MPKGKWRKVNVSPELYQAMKNGDLERIYEVKEKPKKKEVPYLEIIYTGKQPESTWENPDKVKFPAWCTYVWGEERRLGQINKILQNGNDMYELHDVDTQSYTHNRMGVCESVGQLIHYWGIQIVKVKIIVKRDE